MLGNYMTTNSVADFFSNTILLCLLLLTTSCGGGEEKKSASDEASVSLGGTLNAVQEMAKQAEEQQKNGPVETVDFRKLKELLPAEAEGLNRKSATGEKNGMAGFAFSTATARYENDDNSQHVDLSIVDTGGTAALMGMAAWSMIEMDKETESGYEKTTKIGDNRAYEKFESDSKKGELAVLIRNRFIVTVKGRGLDMNKLKSVFDEVDVDKLSDLTQ